MSPDEAIVLAVISLGAFFIPLLCERLLLPSAVGEICFGLALGLVFKSIPETMPTVRFLSVLGFIILMYLAGLEIDVQTIRAAPKKELLLYVFFFALVMAGSFGIARVARQPVIYALVYQVTAIGLLFPVLKDTGLLKKGFGKALLIIGGIGEILSLLAVTLFTLYFRYGVTKSSLLHLAGILAFFIISYLMLRLFKLYIWWNPHTFEAFLKTGTATETGIRANFVNMFVFVSLSAIFDIELIIGAFLAGILFALIFREREPIIEKMSAFGYGFLIPLFFIEAGLRFDIAGFFSPAILAEAAAISLAMLAVRFVSAFILVFSSLTLRQIIMVPFGLSFPLTLLVAVAAIGLEMEAITKDQGAVILLASIITSLVYPWVFKLMAKRWFPPSPAEG